MKKIFYIKGALTALTAVTLLSSCLKDDSRYVDFASSKPLVELPAATGVAGSGVFQANSYAIVSTPTPLNVQVNVAAPKPLSSALTVKLSVDQAALTAYNTANNTNYTLLPAADYSSSLSVTIPANQNSANLVVNINTSLIDPSQSYVLPLTITDASGQQISNYKTLLYNIQVKNKYDGVYTVTGTMVDGVNSALTGSYPRTVDLITQGASTVAYYDTGIGNFAHSILNGGTASYYGSFAPVFNFDATTNKVTSVVNYYGQPASNGRSAVLDATGTVNAVTGTPGTAGSVIKVKYILVQAGVNRTTFDETLTYTGPRS